MGSADRAADQDAETRLETEDATRGDTVQTVLRMTLPALAAVGVAGAAELFRNRFQHRQLFHPTRYPVGIWDPAIYGLPYRDVWFESEDGEKLHGWWIQHPDPVATIVFCHGNTGSVGNRIALYLQLRRLAVNLFTFDYRGYGRSSGQPSEKGLFRDVRSACDLVREAQGIPRERTILFGHSLGGAVAIDGALHRPVAGLRGADELHPAARHGAPQLSRDAPPPGGPQRVPQP